MKSSYVERAERFIQQVASYIDGCTDYIDLNRAMCDFMMEHPRRNISVKHGMARMALVTSDYVIKMNYDDDWVDSVGGCEEEMEFYSPTCSSVAFQFRLDQNQSCMLYVDFYPSIHLQSY